MSAENGARCDKCEEIDCECGGHSDNIDGNDDEIYESELYDGGFHFGKNFFNRLSHD